MNSKQQKVVDQEIKRNLKRNVPAEMDAAATLGLPIEISWFDHESKPHPLCSMHIRDLLGFRDELEKIGEDLIAKGQSGAVFPWLNLFNQHIIRRN